MAKDKTTASPSSVAKLDKGSVVLAPIPFDPKKEYAEAKTGWAQIVYDTERYLPVEGSDLRIKISIVRPKPKGEGK